MTKNSSSTGRIAGVVAAIIALLMCIGLTATRGHVKGTEFAASHFQLREFEFYQIPLINVQITPIWRRPSSSNLMLYLAGTNLINIPVGSPVKWDVVAIQYGSASPLAADAALFVGMVDTEQSFRLWRNYRASDIDLEKWTDDHPERAKVLWPAVQRLCERELYVLIPEIIKNATTDESGDFVESLDDYLSAQEAQMAEDFAEADQMVQAKIIVKEGLQDRPRDARLLALKERFKD